MAADMALAGCHLRLRQVPDLHRPQREGLGTHQELPDPLDPQGMRAAPRPRLGQDANANPHGLQYPTGFQFSTVESTYHGYAQLDKGVTGTFFSTYFFSQDASATMTTQTSITGGGVWADGQVYTKVDKVPTASYVWSPCGAQGILNVNNRLALTTTDKTASGQLTNDDATFKFTQNLQLLWRPCPK